MIILRTPGESNNQLTSKVRDISRLVADVIPEVYLEGVTNKKGMIRKTAHEYEKAFKGEFGQVRDLIIVEASWLGHHEPFNEMTIHSYIYEMMMSTDQEQLARDYSLLPFELKVLDKKRTFCEKIMSLVRFSNSENPIEALNNKIRHCYDINRLLQDKEVVDFFQSAEFDRLLLKVAQDDIASYRSGNEWLMRHPKDAIIFSETEDTWRQLRNTYLGVFKGLVFGNFPGEDKIVISLKKVAARLRKVDWNIVLS